ncbi:MAG: MFS transporter [Hoeflea sp.]|uniref:MFS transporter n=1 Tax=Hoeflea sp. TaxID=1940281 RepID=UPI001DF67A37|nr:MFS transporter [Hoeflea sp.]MBU4530062.1 MFS transporter [Alphaproteobacteria bacterium]MBU4542653.1 MFS transporter [Alphaproteobacteria bacterium]MBU4551334.1 MFS transporter [Alphaproteobacteria bacterium]MBV1723157.1 MFS transporter [Hoeflea sp.]MBV1760168.1 MFS transporter [Hoeflea sp.]
MSSLRPLFPLLTTAGVLLAGNGLQGTLITLRGSAEGFSATVIGLAGAGYYLGFIIGCWMTPWLLRTSGHIRAFAAMTAIAACASLAMVMVIDPFFWFLMRLVTGVCFVSLFANVESWINAQVTNSTRARTLAIYRFVDLAAVTASQYLLPVFGVGGFEIFAVMTMLIILSIVPVSLADRSNPAPPAPFSFNPKRLWMVSPLACAGVVTVGLTTASFRSVGPLYAEGLGLGVADIASFMSAGIIGGIVLQYPLGYLSDIISRRSVLLMATAGSTLTGLAMVWFAGSSVALNLIGIFLWGAFTLPLYSLSAAHANDKAEAGEYVQIASGLMFFWAIGASIGPLLSAVLVDWLGASAFFAFICAMHGAFVVYTIVRIIRGEPDDPDRGQFAGLLRTSPIFARMAAQSVDRPGKRADDQADEAQPKAEENDPSSRQDKTENSG